MQVGFSSEGRLVAVDIQLYNNAGNSLDLSASVMDRALMHADNCYRAPNFRVKGFVCRTNTASNTAFRGFGGPQVGWLLQLPPICCSICCSTCGPDSAVPPDLLLNLLLCLWAAKR